MGDRERGYAHRIDIRADALAVWRALTEAEQLICWCSPKAEIRACRGGHFRASVDRLTEFEAHIDVFEPGRRLRLIYLPAKALPPADTVRVDDFFLDPGPKATVVRIMGSGVPAAPEWYTQYQRLRLGWQHAMSRLKVYVEARMRSTPPEE
jgi:uncharacterized protein YndB with AHSA1/START domain